MTRATSAPLTIFEGVDGAGKSTAARAFAEKTGALYVHLPAFKGVTTGQARMYVDAMMPAVMGYQPVVMDRCWLSEAPYGTVFREGVDRIGDASIRMLERLALRCGAVLIMCDPGIEAIKASYAKRHKQEMLDNVEQVVAVYRMYDHTRSALPTVFFNYLTQGDVDLVTKSSLVGGVCHPLKWRSAGGYYAKTIVVGEAFADHKNDDAFYQWPFASFSKLGCSQWLTQQLKRRESDLFWINADQDLSMIRDRFWTSDPHFKDNMAGRRNVLALGDVAYRKLTETCGDKIHVVKLPHPQYHKRFNTAYPYDGQGLL